MMKLEIAGKATLFAVAISCITTGTTLIKDNFQAGLASLIVGVALMVIWAFLIDYEARREAVKAAREAFEKFKPKLEGKNRG
jgi:hypothetical protein